MKHSQWIIFAKEVIYGEVRKIVPKRLVKHYFRITIARYGDIPPYLAGIFPNRDQVHEYLSKRTKEFVADTFTRNIEIMNENNDSSRRCLLRLKTVYHNVFPCRPGLLLSCLRCGHGKKKWYYDGAGNRPHKSQDTQEFESMFRSRH